MRRMQASLGYWKMRVSDRKMSFFPAMKTEHKQSPPNPQEPWVSQELFRFTVLSLINRGVVVPTIGEASCVDLLLKSTWKLPAKLPFSSQRNHSEAPIFFTWRWNCNLLPTMMASAAWQSTTHSDQGCIQQVDLYHGDNGNDDQSAWQRPVCKEERSG